MSVGGWRLASVERHFTGRSRQGGEPFSEHLKMPLIAAAKRRIQRVNFNTSLRLVVVLSGCLHLGDGT